MRLNQIKLVGFKSFVDPTTLKLQSNLTGIVGPNGCGKSNIMDAVRWVMGEISAKQLRGVSMSDVIFNGSSSRKPVGQAAVELLFDNSDASLGGEYAKYQEISIKRVVDRDGGSDYFLNSTRCRRKDITDIFLGTGLGPRSYAIIEQGTISQLIDAKPDELRVYIEEAAGISKYKERRRETENRIKHTKENLNRLHDIQEELEKQLKHLNSQANAANRYKKLKIDERLTKGQLHTLQWHELAEQIATQDQVIRIEESRLEDKITEQHHLEAKISESRELQNSSNENFNEVQGRYYLLGANIARLEQQIQHSKDRAKQLQDDLEQANQAWQETLQHQSADQGQIETLNLEKHQLEPEMLIASEQAVASQQELQIAEQNLRDWQQHWDEFNIGASQVMQRFEVEQTRIQHLEQRIAIETQTLEKLKAELSGLDFGALTSELEGANSEFGNIKSRYDDLHSGLATKQQQITAQRDQNSQLTIDLAAMRNRLHNLSGRHASLEALQQTALGKNDEVLVGWLEQHQLAAKPRLAQGLKTETGWETAVETVLGSYLEAVCIEGFDPVVEKIKHLKHGNLVLFNVDYAHPPSSSVKAITLASKISSTWPVVSLLDGIYIAENLDEALTLRSSLTPSESVITKDGIWMGASWLRIAYDSQQKAGVLQRERELETLNNEIIAEKNHCLVKEQELQQKLEALRELENQHQSLQQELRTITAEYSEIQGQVSSKKTHLEHLYQREQSLTSEITSHHQAFNAASEQLIEVKSLLDAAIIQKAADDQRRMILISERDQLQQAMGLARNRANQDREQADNLVVRSQLLKTQLEYLRQSLERAEQRLVGLKERQTSLNQLLAEAVAPLTGINQELEQQLAQRLHVETELTIAKQRVSAIENTLRELEKNRTTQQDELEQIRSGLEKLRTDRQGLQIRCATYQEKIAELDYNLETLLQEMPDEANIAEWNEKLDNLVKRIDRLGPINLAAIDEFAELQERKNYLDSQSQDLISALNTLESAIRRIDHDTRARFKETFETINATFQELFPKIFNGGKAYLQLTSDDLLETGVEILAQPPGKRNASIHLLSGGEKALTATALVFAIFQLNPAPFCMLDEVDAPLDDLNVGRFCNLVKEMSQKIQFIYVTHNKLSMETAQQLAGVTMQEPGVSRLVSVDIDAAIRMAE